MPRRRRAAKRTARLPNRSTYRGSVRDRLLDQPRRPAPALRSSDPGGPHPTLRKLHSSVLSFAFGLRTFAYMVRSSQLARLGPVVARGANPKEPAMTRSVLALLIT